MRFTGKVALITAAGRGIGRATAEIIGREGGTVVAVDNDKAALEQVLGAIRGAGGTAHGRTADALDAFQAKDVVRSTLETHGRIDILLPRSVAAPASASRRPRSTSSRSRNGSISWTSTSPARSSSSTRWCRS